MFKKYSIFILVSASLTAFANDSSSPNNDINQFNNQMAIMNTITIKAGNHTAEQNAHHREICQSENAVDVTDLTDIHQSSGASDTIICYSPLNINPNSIMPQVPTIIAHAPSLYTGGRPYLLKGTATYSGGTIGRALTMSLGVPNDNCTVSGGANLTMTQGIAYIQTTCSYPTGTYRRNSVMQAYLEGRTSTSLGWVQ